MNLRRIRETLLEQNAIKEYYDIQEFLQNPYKGLLEETRIKLSLLEHDNFEKEILEWFKGDNLDYKNKIIFGQLIIWQEVNIAYTDGLAGVVLEDVQEKMNTSTSAAILNKQTIYKQIIFNSNAFEELLGDEGTIKIYNKEDRLLGIVAKDTRTDKEGNYLIELLEEVSQVKMVTESDKKRAWSIYQLFCDILL
mgnify:CR=1 FL=1